MTKSLIILAGGASSRMKASSAIGLSQTSEQEANTVSKALIQVQGRPMLDYVLYNAKKAGLTHIYIVISLQGSLFKKYYGNKPSGNSFNGLTISYVTQHIPTDRKKPLGTADAVFQALEKYPHLQNDSFLVCNCDNLYSKEAFLALRKSPAQNAFINYDQDALSFSMERISCFALTKVNAQNYLEDIIEKPRDSELESYRDSNGKFCVSMNIFKFDGGLFYSYLQACKIHPQRKEKELPAALLQMVKEHPESMLGIAFSEHVPDLTSKDDIFIMNDYLTTHFANLDWN